MSPDVLKNPFSWLARPAASDPGCQRVFTAGAVRRDNLRGVLRRGRLGVEGRKNWRFVCKVSNSQRAFELSSYKCRWESFIVCKGLWNIYSTRGDACLPAARRQLDPRCDETAGPAAEMQKSFFFFSRRSPCLFSPCLRFVSWHLVLPAWLSRADAAAVQWPD